MDGTMGRVVIRPLRVEETPLPEDFLYEAIWQPDPARRVPRANPAGRLYLRLGFRIVGEHAGERIMRCELR